MGTSPVASWDRTQSRKTLTPLLSTDYGLIVKRRSDGRCQVQAQRRRILDLVITFRLRFLLVCPILSSVGC